MLVGMSGISCLVENAYMYVCLEPLALLRLRTLEK